MHAGSANQLLPRLLRPFIIHTGARKSLAWPEILPGPRILCYQAAGCRPGTMLRRREVFAGSPVLRICPGYLSSKFVNCQFSEPRPGCSLMPIHVQVQLSVFYLHVIYNISAANPFYQPATSFLCVTLQTTHTIRTGSFFGSPSLLVSTALSTGPAAPVKLIIRG